MKIIMMLLVCVSVVAEPYKPQDPNIVLASWEVETVAGTHISAEQKKKQLRLDLQRAQKPGQSYLYGVVQSRLVDRIEASQDSEEWLLWAETLQHSHQFKEAELWLNKVLQSEPRNPQAHILLAQMALIQQRFDTAKSHCLQLLDGGDITTVSVCLLQVASHQGQLSESYQKLANLWSQVSEPEYRVWMALILSDMAERMHDVIAAEQWLEEVPLQGSSISHIQAWADIKLKNGQAQEVLSRLHALKKQEPALEDGLLLRLAIAQKHFNRASKQIYNPWQQEISQKIKLREQRADIHHAKDMALYYLEFTNDAKKALYWAEINWQQAKEYGDSVVLNRARQLAGIQNQSQESGL